MSYLRAGSKNRKKKKDKLDIDGKNVSSAYSSSKPTQPIDDVPLYDDVGDYVPSLKRSDDKRRGDDDRHRKSRDRRDEERVRRNYFERDPREAEEEQQKGFSNQDK